MIKGYYIYWIIYLLNFQISTSEYIKPKFFPYCKTRGQCKAACSCEAAKDAVMLEITDELRKNILYYHNEIRDIQSAGEPMPAGMAMLQYDMNLEEISQCWAAKCQNEYSECFVTPLFPETSQTVVQVSLEKKAAPQITLWYEMMSFWLAQAKSVSAETLSDLPDGPDGENIHNFAQLLSDRVLSVGCGWSNLNGSVTFVCTYGPRGPTRGEPIYRIGQLCTRCPFNYACDDTRPFKRLCKITAAATSQIPTPPSPPPLPPTTPPSPPPSLPPSPPAITTTSLTAPPFLPPIQYDLPKFPKPSHCGEITTDRNELPGFTKNYGPPRLPAPLPGSTPPPFIPYTPIQRNPPLPASTERCDVPNAYGLPRGAIPRLPQSPFIPLPTIQRNSATQSKSMSNEYIPPYLPHAPPHPHVPPQPPPLPRFVHEERPQYFQPTEYH